MKPAIFLPEVNNLKTYVEGAEYNWEASSKWPECFLDHLENKKGEYPWTE